MNTRCVLDFFMIYGRFGIPLLLLRELDDEILISNGKILDALNPVVEIFRSDNIIGISYLCHIIAFMKNLFEQYY
jgi:hypothetical protein